VGSTVGRHKLAKQKLIELKALLSNKLLLLLLLLLLSVCFMVKITANRCQ